MNETQVEAVLSPSELVSGAKPLTNGETNIIFKFAILRHIS